MHTASPYHGTAADLDQRCRPARIPRPKINNTMTTSLESLLEQKAVLERQINEAQRTARATAIAQIRALMTAHGLTPADLASSTAGAPRRGAVSARPVAPKYRHPTTGQTWSGRGLKPKWLAEELAAGNTVDDFKI